MVERSAVNRNVGSSNLPRGANFSHFFYLKYAHKTKIPRSLRGRVVGHKSSEGSFMEVALAAIPLRQLLRYLVGVAYQYFVSEVVVLSHADKIVH
jgi:hypothetical protein